MRRWLGALLLTAGCGGDGGGAASTAGSWDWIIEEGTRLPQATSSCTVRLSDDSWRLYLSGITTATSSDGLTWSAPTNVGLAGAGGEFLRNPAVLPQSDGTFLMIYEGVTNNTSMRFYRAVSSDGITFVKTPGALTSGAVLLPESDESDFISVPDLVRVDASTIRVYFVAGGDHVESAVSTDEGFTWTREGAIAVSGLAEGQWIVDPDVVRLDDGQWRLFFATPPDGVSGLSNKRIRSALSTYGRVFVAEAGDRVGVEDASQDRLDPDVVRLPDGRYRMYFGEATRAGGGYDLRSALSP